MDSFKLDSCPSDGISNLSFGSTDDLLVASSWDSGIHLYNTSTNKKISSFTQKGPVLDAKLVGNRIFGGGLESVLYSYNIETGTRELIGRHENAIKNIATSKTNPDLIMSGSWDKTLKIWDTRSGGLVETIGQSGKIYSMDAIDSTIVLALEGRVIQIYDLRNTKLPQERRDSSLKHMLRTVSVMKNGKGYATGSVEGRIAVDYFDNSTAIQSKKFSFKCHRQKVLGDLEQIYSVNAIAFHPKKEQAFASGGSDGVVNVWEASLKKKLQQYDPYPTSISALDFNANGTLLAIASSYTFDEGEKDHPPDSIIIKQISDQDITAKPKF